MSGRRSSRPLDLESVFTANTLHRSHRDIHTYPGIRAMQVLSHRRRSFSVNIALTNCRIGSISGRHHSRAGSWGQRLIQALSEPQDSMAESKGSLFPDDRVWYDQFTSTDWVHDSIADAYRVKALRGRKDFWGRVYVLFDGAQGWILSALVGFVIAVIAYVVDVTEAVAFDYKYGYCARAWYFTEKVRRARS
jgi:hypothetical protein